MSKPRKLSRIIRATVLDSRSSDQDWNPSSGMDELMVLCCAAVWNRRRGSHGLEQQLTRRIPRESGTLEIATMLAAGLGHFDAHLKAHRKDRRIITGLHTSRELNEFVVEWTDPEAKRVGKDRCRMARGGPRGGRSEATQADVPAPSIATRGGRTLDQQLDEHLRRHRRFGDQLDNMATTFRTRRAVLTATRGDFAGQPTSPIDPYIWARNFIATSMREWGLSGDDMLGPVHVHVSGAIAAITEGFARHGGGPTGPHPSWVRLLAGFAALCDHCIEHGPRGRWDRPSAMIDGIRRTLTARGAKGEWTYLIDRMAANGPRLATITGIDEGADTAELRDAITGDEWTVHRGLQRLDDDPDRSLTGAEGELWLLRCIEDYGVATRRARATAPKRLIAPAARLTADPDAWRDWIAAAEGGPRERGDAKYRRLMRFGPTNHSWPTFLTQRPRNADGPWTLVGLPDKA